jgi:peptidoglycan/LPS O-acetylase OafA/YrhL
MNVPPAEAAPNLTPPPGNPRFPLLDALRAAAALSVFFGHTITGVFTLAGHPELFTLATEFAYQGVAIFFVLSGFLLYRPFLTARARGRRMSLVSYAERRALRIVPAYWVALSICLALGVVHGVTTSNWWVFYGFGQNYRFSTIGSGIGVAWTLGIEVTFYAVLPLLALIAARLARGRVPTGSDVALLVVLAVASLAYRQHFSAFADLAKASTLLGTFFWFALGMGLALASMSNRVTDAMSVLAGRRSWWAGASWLAAAALFALLHVLQWDAHLSATPTHVLYGVIAFCIVLPGVFGDNARGPVRGILELRVLAWVGLISYSFYLYHTIVIQQLDKLVISPPALRYVAVTAIALPVSCALAATSYYVLERPLMRLPRLTARASATARGASGGAGSGSPPRSS